MIVVRGRARETGRGNYSDIAHYAVDRNIEHGSENTYQGYVEFFDIACAPHLKLAIAEVMAIQSCAKGLRSDPNMHLIASFPPGEHPTHAQLADIARALRASIGMEGHPMIASLHQDTDCDHLHIALSRVHATTFAIVNPHNDYLTLERCARELEIKHGLIQVTEGRFVVNADGQIVDRGRPRGQRLTKPARVVESQQGIESFQRWALREVAPSVKAVLAQPGATWNDLHQAAARFGLEVRRHGAGFVILDPKTANATARLSQIGISKVEQAIGPFEDASPTDPTPAVEMRYRAQPMDHDLDSKGRTQRLFEQWQAEKKSYANLRATLRSERQALSNQARARRGEIATAAAQVRRSIRGSGLPVAERKIRYAIAKAERALQETNLRTWLDNERARLNALARDESPGSWQDFLIREAELGRTEALIALRRRRTSTTRQPVGVPALGGNEIRTVVRPLLDLRHRVTKAGIIEYRDASGAVKLVDQGQRVLIPDMRNPATVEMALRLAVAKYGRTISVDAGSGAAGTSFKELCCQIAAEKNLSVAFVDPSMEALRQALTQMRTEQFAKHRKKNHERIRKSGFIGIGTQGRRAPTHWGDHLQELSSIRLVHNFKPGEVFLPGNEHNHVDQRRRQRAHGSDLRRAEESASGIRSGTGSRTIPLVHFDIPLADQSRVAALGLSWDDAAGAFAAEAGSPAAIKAAQFWPVREHAQENAPTTDGNLGLCQAFAEERNRAAVTVSTVPPHEAQRLAVLAEMSRDNAQQVRFVGRRELKQPRDGTMDAAILEVTEVATGRKKRVVVPLTHEFEGALRAQRVREGDLIRLDRELRIEILERGKGRER